MFAFRGRQDEDTGHVSEGGDHVTELEFHARALS